MNKGTTPGPLKLLRSPDKTNMWPLCRNNFTTQGSQDFHRK